MRGEVAIRPDESRRRIDDPIDEVPDLSLDPAFGARATSARGAGGGRAVGGSNERLERGQQQRQRVHAVVEHVGRPAEHRIDGRGDVRPTRSPDVHRPGEAREEARRPGLPEPDQRPGGEARVAHPELAVVPGARGQVLAGPAVFQPGPQDRLGVAGIAAVSEDRSSEPDAGNVEAHAEERGVEEREPAQRTAPRERYFAAAILGTFESARRSSNFAIC